MYEMYEQLKTRAEGVSAEVYRFETKALALDFIVGFLQREGVADRPNAHALWAACPFLDGIDRQPLAAVAGLKFQVTRELAAEARFGISQLGWALADTGTLVQDATAVEERLVSTLPDIHIAIVPTSGLLPDMPALLERLRPEQSNYIAFITGPSRTADIERVLTIGVHGPERLVIVFVDELKTGTDDHAEARSSRRRSNTYSNGSFQRSVPSEHRGKDVLPQTTST